MALATLTVDLILKAGGFESDIGRASRTAQKRMKEIEKSANALGVSVGTALRYLGTALTTGAIGYALKSAVDRADELYNAAQKIGVTTEALSGLEYAAKLSDVSLEQLQGGLAKMVKYQAAAAEGNKEAVATFHAFGIELKDTSGHLRDSQAVLLEWARVFADLPDGAEKTALALRVFGKSGADLIPFLNEGQDGIAALTAKAKELGLVISDQTGAAADHFNDQLDELKGILQGVATTVAADLLPDLIQLAEALQHNVEGASAGAKAVDVLRTVMGLVGDVGHGVNIMFSTMGLTLGFVAEQASHLVDYFSAVARMDFSGVASAIAAMRKETALFDESRAALHEDPKKSPGMGEYHARGGMRGHYVFHGDTQAAAAGLFQPEAAASKGAAAANHAAAQAAKERADREKELRDAIQKVTEASTEFKTQLEDLTAEQAGPAAQAQLDYTRKLKDLHELAGKGEVSDSDLAAAEKLLAEQFAKTTAEIEKRENPGRQVLADLQQQIDLTNMATQAERDRAQFLHDNINATDEQADAYARMQKQLGESQKSIQFADQFRDHWADAFASIADGSKTVGEAFSDLATSIIADIARMAAEKWVEKLFGEQGTALGGSGGGGIGGFISSLFGSAKGNVFDHGVALTAFARGGIVDRPTLFPMARGMGLMGEAGPEAVMPLARDALGRLGVRARGGGGGDVYQTINVQGRPDERTAYQIQQRAFEKQQRAMARNR